MAKNPNNRGWRLVWIGALVFLTCLAGCRDKSPSSPGGGASGAKSRGWQGAGLWATADLSRILILGSDDSFQFHSQNGDTLSTGLGYSSSGGRYRVRGSEQVELLEDSGVVTLQIGQAADQINQLILTETTGATRVQQKFSKLNSFAGAEIFSPAEKNLLPAAAGKVLFALDQAGPVEINYALENPAGPHAAYKLSTKGRPDLKLHLFRGENQASYALFSNATSKQAYLTRISRDEVATKSTVSTSLPDAPATAPGARYEINVAENRLSLSEIP